MWSAWGTHSAWLALTGWRGRVHKGRGAWRWSGTRGWDGACGHCIAERVDGADCRVLISHFPLYSSILAASYYPE